MYTIERDIGYRGGDFIINIIIFFNLQLAHPLKRHVRIDFDAHRCGYCNSRARQSKQHKRKKSRVLRTYTTPATRVYHVLHTTPTATGGVSIPAVCVL